MKRAEGERGALRLLFRYGNTVLGRRGEISTEFLNLFAIACSNGKLSPSNCRRFSSLTWCKSACFSTPRRSWSRFTLFEYCLHSNTVSPLALPRTLLLYISVRDTCMLRGGRLYCSSVLENTCVFVISSELCSEENKVLYFPSG